MTAVIRAFATRERMLLAAILAAPLFMTGCTTARGPMSSHGVDTMRTFRGAPPKNSSAGCPTPPSPPRSGVSAPRRNSVGQRRQLALHGGRRDKLEVSPNLWAGVGLIRGGVGTALVGSPATVAARLREYQAMGTETIIASGYPHLEEAYRVAELLFPALHIGKRVEPGRDFRPAETRPIAAE